MPDPAATPATTATTSPSNAPLPPVTPPSAPDPQLAALRNELNQLRANQDRLNTHITTTQAVNNVPQTKPVDTVELTKTFLKDPLNSTAAIAQNISQATTRQALSEFGPALETLKEVAKQTVRAKDPELFDKYAVEIQARVDAVPENFRNSVHVWDNAFVFAKGEHYREIMDAEREKTPRGPAVHISTEGGPSSPSRSAPSPPAAKLSEDEKEQARKFGLTNEQYLHGKQAYENQSEKGPSSWDEYITFDSRDRNRKERDARRKQRTVA